MFENVPEWKRVTISNQIWYFYAKITSDGKIDKEISVRIGKATGAFNQLNNIGKNENIGIKH